MLDPSTNILLDTCSVLNMVNGKVLNLICSLPYNFFIGPIVHGECTRQQCLELDFEIERQKINLLDGNQFSVSLFAELSDQYSLGDGETECIAYGKTLKYVVSTDDKTARNAVTKELGDDFVIGSIGLLKIAVDKKLLDCSEAFDRYKLMVSTGGFLPKLPEGFFCN